MQNTTMKFLLPASYLADMIVNLTSTYQKATGIGVELVVAPDIVAYFSVSA